VAASVAVMVAAVTLVAKLYCRQSARVAEGWEYDKSKSEFGYFHRQ